VVSATKNYNWDGKNKVEAQWSFAGAMLYSVTVITTIGSLLVIIIIIAASQYYYARRCGLLLPTE